MKFQESFEVTQIEKTFLSVGTLDVLGTVLDLSINTAVPTKVLSKVSLDRSTDGHRHLSVGGSGQFTDVIVAPEVTKCYGVTAETLSRGKAATSHHTTHEQLNEAPTNVLLNVPSTCDWFSREALRISPFFSGPTSQNTLQNTVSRHTEGHRPKYSGHTQGHRRPIFEGPTNCAVTLQHFLVTLPK